VRGVLRGVAAWQHAGRPTRLFDLVTPLDYVMARERRERIQLLDVRAPNEWDVGHLSDSVHRYVPDLVAGVPDELDAARPVWIGCASGHRASIAAGLLERHGLQPVVLATSGIPELLQRRATVA
jgi:hydroxyacylglutathione hydrolase